MFPTEPAPEKIGAYKILRRLAGSGSASVYLGRLEGPMGFQRVCALKLVPNTAEGDPRFAEELAREAAICAQLNHPAIVRMFDFFEHADMLVLVLEHVEGTNLDRLFQHLVARQQKLGDVAVYYLAHRIAGALAHAHAATDEQGGSAPVIHRNLHPENIVLGWDGQVRLTGFGLGKIVGRTPDTVAGVVKGTPGYMAPEQSRGEPVTTKADVYGMGLLLWSLLSGRRPPADGTRPTGISTLRHDLPRPIVALIDAALAPLPDERRITCQEIEVTLGKIARPEKGKAELVLKIQSAHATIEIEDADREEERRPTIPVKGKNAQTTRPGETTKRFARTLLAKDLGSGGGLRKDAPGQTEAPVAPEPGELRESEGIPAAEPSEAITIPVPPSASQMLVDLRGEDWKPALPDRETFERLFEASKRASRPGPPEPDVETLNVEPDGVDDEPDPVTAQFVPMGAGKFMLLGGAQTGAYAAGNEGVDPGAPGAAVSPAAPVLDAALGRLPLPSPIAFGPPPALPQGNMQIPFGAPPGSLADAPPAFVAHAGGPTPVSSPALSLQTPSGPPAETASPRARHPSLFGHRARSLSTAGTIAVSAITATIVAIVWIYLTRREQPAPAAEGEAEAASTSVPIAVAPPPPPRSAPMPAPKPASASASASASAPPPSATARAAAGRVTEEGTDLAALPAGYGYLTVSFHEPASVYVSGKLAGPASEALRVRCGRWFVRLSKTGAPRIPEWLTLGMTVHVPCQGSTRVDMKPAPKQARAPRKR